MERIYIGMGSNLAAPEQQLRSAIEALAQLPGTHLAGVSAFYQSDSLLPGQPRYTNAVAALDSRLATGQRFARLCLSETRGVVTGDQNSGQQQGA